MQLPVLLHRDCDARNVLGPPRLLFSLDKALTHWPQSAAKPFALASVHVATRQMPDNSEERTNRRWKMSTVSLVVLSICRSMLKLRGSAWPCNATCW